jgi:hypothetical protein
LFLVFRFAAWQTVFIESGYLPPTTSNGRGFDGIVFTLRLVVPLFTDSGTALSKNCGPSTLNLRQDIGFVLGIVTSIKDRLLARHRPNGLWLSVRIRQNLYTNRIHSHTAIH